MRIFLLPKPAGHYVGYFEEKAPPPEKEASNPAAQKNRWQRLRARLAEGYQRLEKKRPLPERLAARLRKAETLEVLYPADLSEKEAAEHFFDFLRRQARHEGAWKKRDAVIACLGAPLFVLPGPNVWFYYPAIRAMGHYYAESGCKRFLRKPSGKSGQPPIQFAPSPELAEISHLVQTQKRRHWDRSRISEIGRALGLSALVQEYR